MIVRDLFNHMEWADALMWRAALTSDGVAGDDTLRWQILHLHTVQQAFLDAWTGQPPAFRDTCADTTLSRELPGVRRYYARARGVLASLGDRELGAPIVLPWAALAAEHFGRSPESMTLGETILQVLMHSVHHRAQANMRLRALGAEPPLVDYIAWLWLGRPKADWPPLDAPAPAE